MTEGGMCVQGQGMFFSATPITLGYGSVGPWHTTWRARQRSRGKMKSLHNTTHTMTLCVLAAGVAGLAAAWALHQQGFRLRVMNAHEEVFAGVKREGDARPWPAQVWANTCCMHCVKALAATEAGRAPDHAARTGMCRPGWTATTSTRCRSALAAVQPSTKAIPRP